jgi:hypothetical protein
MRLYADTDGNVYFVSTGIAEGQYMTVRRRRYGIGTHRVKSPRLPLRQTEEEAWKDLEAYAASKHWRLEVQNA